MISSRNIVLKKGQERVAFLTDFFRIISVFILFLVNHSKRTARTNIYKTDITQSNILVIFEQFLIFQFRGNMLKFIKIQTYQSV